MENMGDDLRRRIRVAMLVHKVTVWQWAKRAKISPNGIYNLFAGRSDSLNSETVNKLARGINLTASQLMDDEQYGEHVLIRMIAEATSLGGRIEIVRRYVGMTQTEFADKMGVKQASISRWEKDGATPDDDAGIRKIAALAGLSPALIRYGGNEAAPATVNNVGLFLTPTPLVRWQLQQLHKGPDGTEHWRDVPGVTMSAEGK